MDRINNRMQDEVHKMISDLDKECMRKLQVSCVCLFHKAIIGNSSDN